MSNPSKDKGDRCERLLVAWLVQNGYPMAHRSRAGWSDDIGDVLGVPGLVIEAKSAKQMRIGPWLDELDVEKRNAGCADGVLIVRRPGWPDAGDWFAVRRVRDEFRQ